MSNQAESKNESQNWFKKIIRNPWLLLVMEVATFVVLVFKLLPESWIKTGWPLLLLITIALIGLLISNFRLTRIILHEKEQRGVKIEELKNQHDALVRVLEKKAKYAEIIPMLNNAFQEIHHAVRQDHEDKTKYHEAFMTCCESLEKTFSYVTGVPCHVCIKMTVFPKNQLQSFSKFEKSLDNITIRTYCRSSSSLSSRIQIDQENYSHPIKENSDFEYIYKNKDDCFFSNDLTELPVYKNSSFKLKHKTCEPFKVTTSQQQKIEDWKLGYRATIVAPILPLRKESKNEHIVLGLLCVDSKVPGVFDKELDTHILIGCADGIYNSFKKLFTINEPSTKNKNPQDGKQNSQSNA